MQLLNSMRNTVKILRLRRRVISVSLFTSPFFILLGVLLLFSRVKADRLDVTYTDSQPLWRELKFPTTRTFSDNVQTILSKEDNVCRSEICHSIGSSIKESMDLSVDPCSDFNSYCCGHYLLKEEPTFENDKYGAFDVVQNNILKKLKYILLKNSSSDSFIAETNLKRYYKACSNQSAIDDRGIGPITKLLADIGGWPAVNRDWKADNFDLLSMMAAIQLKTGIGYIFHMSTVESSNDTSKRFIQLSGYADNIKNNRSVLHSMFFNKTFFSRIVNLLGANSSDTEKDFEYAIEFVDKMSEMMNTNEELNATNIKEREMTIEDLQTSIPEINWLYYLQKVTNSSLSALGEDFVLQNTDIVIISDYSFVSKVVKYIANPQHNRQIADYLGWKLMLSQLIHLPSNFTESAHKLFPDWEFVRWKSCAHLSTELFSYIATYMYVKEYVPPHITYEVEKLALDIKLQFENMIENNSWMDNSTKKAALQKIRLMKPLVGYPKWMDDEKARQEQYNSKQMPQMTDDAFHNEIVNSQHNFMTEIEGLRKKVIEEKKWTMNPLDVNAKYTRELNLFTIPVAIYQPPFYDVSLPSYYNYGALGAVIGHEISHGFDNSGRKFNAYGKLENWWSNDSNEIFEKEATCFVQDYNKYGLDGNLTLGENFADNGGLRGSYRAYFIQGLKNVTKQLLPGLETFSVEQLFFMSFGSLWCTKYKESPLEYALKYPDEHPPAPYRVNVSISNSEYFWKAFNCKPNSPERPNKTCNIW